VTDSAQPSERQGEGDESRFGPAELSGLLGHIAFISLAPFLGAAETNEFLRQKTRTK
jgi:hypothetical protein